MNNRKLLLTALVTTFTTLGAFAQAMVTSTNLEKENRNAVMIQIDQPADITMNALEQRMKRSGLSGKEHNNVTIYKAVTLPEIVTEKVDIYTKVEQGEDKNRSTVYLAVSKGYNNFTTPESDGITTENMKTFLNSFVKDVNVFSLDLMISSQKDIVSNEEKEYEHLLNDQKDLEKNKADIESKLIEKAKEISAKKELIDQKKQALGELESKRAGLN